MDMIKKLGSVIVGVLFVFSMACHSQPAEKGKPDRVPAVAGSFYPSDAGDLTKMLKAFFRTETTSSDEQPLALVVPHAGYIFSGEVAAAGFRMLERDKSFRHIFIIGPAHRTWFNGAAIYTQGNFVTPLGKVPIDPLASELVQKHRLIVDNQAPHKEEHCIEVQLPFLQYWLKKPFSIIPILVGGDSEKTAEVLAEMLSPYFTNDNLFVISADFSHYPAMEDAVKADKSTADAIASNDPAEFLTTIRRNEETYGPELVTSICGWLPALTLLKITEKIPETEYRKVMYRNSGHSSYGDRERVVGYQVMALFRRSGPEKSDDFDLPESDKLRLLELARNTIVSFLSHRSLPTVPEKSLNTNLTMKAGAFVTLKKNGELRGCIGNFASQNPLHQTIQEMAISSAIRDTRFTPVTIREMDRIDIEISVLTPLKRISSIDEFRLGKDGIYIRKGNRSGTFLPQVAEETGWTVEEFLGHCARDKAGLNWDSWRQDDVELYTYQALVFGEEDFPDARFKKGK